jgi:hypothetical protein
VIATAAYIDGNSQVRIAGGSHVLANWHTHIRERRWG